MAKKTTSIFSALGLGRISKKQKDELLDQMVPIVQDKVIDKMMNILSEEESSKLHEAITNNNESYLQSFLKRHEKTIALFMEQEINALKYTLAT